MTEGGSSQKGNLIYFIRNDDEIENQFDWFMINNSSGESSGLSQAGMSN